MLGLNHMSPFKQALFKNFLEFKCYDLQSHSLFIIVWLARFLSELTIVNFSSLVTDSSFTHLLPLYNMAAIFSKQKTPQNFIEGIGVLILMCVLFVCMIFTGPNAENKRAKGIYLKVFGLVIYGLRVFLIKNLADAAYRGYQEGSVTLLIISSVSVSLICVISVLLQEFTVQISLNSSHRSLLSKTYHRFNSMSEALLLLSVILTSIIPHITIEFVSAFSVLLAGSFTLKILSSTLRKKYSSGLTERLQNISCVSGIVFYMSVIPAYFVELLKENLLITIIIVTLFCYHSYTNYLNSLRFDSVNFLESISKSKEELLNRQGKFHLFQAHFLIHYVNFMMTEFKGQKQQILLSSIMVEHFRQCRKDGCYCGNNTETNINKLIIDRDFRGKLLLAFVDNIYKQFAHQFDIFALYIMFKLEIIGIFPQIQHALLKFKSSSKSLTLAQQYLIFQIKNTLKRVLDQKNLSTEYVRVEKAILEEQKAKELLQNLLQVSELTIKRYKLLSEGICNLRLVEENIEQSSSVIKTIELAYQESKSKNQFNLYTQSIFYFYFSNISETNSQASLICNNIYVKSSFLKSLKGLTTANIEKFLYEDQCCVLESNLDPENMGLITNLTENAVNLFDMRKDELLYRNVKKIIPRFMNEEHEASMQDWLATSSYRSINQQKPLYMTTVKNVCFKAVVYHQISTSFDRIKLYTMVLRISGDNYLLLNENMKIQGFGDKIKDNVFSVKALKEPLKNFCVNSRVLPDSIEDIDIDKTHNLDLLLCESKGMHREIHNYDKENFVEQIQQFAAKALKGNINARVLKCKAEMSVLKFARIPYCVIKFLDVVEHTLLQSQIDEIEDESYRIKEVNENADKKVGQKKNLSRNKLLLGQNSYSPRGISECHEEPYEQLKEEDSSSGKMEEGMDDLYEIEDMQKQSTSSISAESSSYSFKKLMKQIKQKFLYERNISYRELNKITLALAIMIIILLLALISQYIFYRNRLQSFQNIMNANQEVSDTLQYVQLMYSQSLLIYQNCLLIFSKEACSDSVKEIKNSYGYFFDLFKSQVGKIVSLKATGDFPFYVYLQESIKVKVGLSQTSMEVQQFLSIFHYTVFKLAVHFQTETGIDEQAYHMLNILKDNWPAIVSINHRILNLYQEQGLHQIDVIAIILFCVSGGIVVVDLAIFILVNHFINSFMSKKQKLVRNYEWVPISYIQEMKKYFEVVIESLQQKKLNNKELSEFPNLEDNSYYRPKNQFFYTTTSGKRILFMACFFLCLTAGNLISLYEMRKVIAPFEKIFVQEKAMISSQKDIIEAYYELKTQYLLEKNQTLRLLRIDKLEKGFKKKQVEFNDRAIILLQIFNQSSSYFHDFKTLLTDDICELSRQMFTDWEYQECKQAHFDYPQFGIFSTLIFIQRSTMVGSHVLKAAQIEEAPQILNRAMYQDIDLYIEYTSKVFYLMQKRISAEMDRFLQDAFFTCLMMILLQFLLVMVGVGFWVWFYRKKKKEFTGLYGHVIVYPNKIIIKNKQVMRQIEEGLVIKDY